MTRDELIASIKTHYQTDTPQLANLYAMSNNFALWLIKHCPDNKDRARALKMLESLTSIAGDSILNKTVDVEINESALPKTKRPESGSTRD